MSSSNSRLSSRAWCWRRWIEPGREDEWIDRLRLLGCDSWALTAKPGRVRILLAAYPKSRAEGDGFVRRWGGRIRLLRAVEWIASRPAPPLQIGRDLRIVHEKTGKPDAKSCPQLHIPQGIAFGSGEHATTSMLLRALTRLADLDARRVLDLGTGSGVLALAARLRGARTIVATDWDADAVRTARQNEALNFRRPTIRWQKADVKRLRARGRYDLVLANLFSGILCEAAGPISEALSSRGKLWLSGILREQERRVIAAYRGKNLRLARSARRGKWVVLQWEKRAPIRQETAGALRKTVQTK